MLLGSRTGWPGHRAAAPDGSGTFGPYHGVLGQLDAVVFTRGVGEHSPTDEERAIAQEAADLLGLPGGW